MNLILKIVTGLIGGIAVVASIGYAEKKRKRRASQVNWKNIDIPAEDIPDSIFDGPLPDSFYEEYAKKKGLVMQKKTEQSVRTLQDGLSKASSVLSQISTICSSIIKIFYDDPYIKTNSGNLFNGSSSIIINDD